MAEREVTVTMTIDATQDQVWRAMTDPGLVEQWMMGAQVDSTWQKGDPITWSGEYNGQPYTDSGEILDIDPGRRLVHTHASTMAPDAPAHTVTWSLDQAGEDKTELSLAQDGAQSDDEAEQFKSNWTAMLDELRTVAER